MINQYNVNNSNIVLSSDLAAEKPLYIFFSEQMPTLLYSDSITELLNSSCVPKPLKISTEGLSFLLQSGVVPPPKTVYQGVYILGIGDTAHISIVNGKIDLKFQHDFPFMSSNRLAVEEMEPDENLILQMLAEATKDNIDNSKQSFLFHSAGKDSNSIALALAEAGWQHKVTLITHKSKGSADESAISLKIAKQLGFKHQTLHEVDQLKAEHYQAIENYFINAPFPCSDNVSLAYPLYTQQLPELKGANIIDGGGNDSYMATPPTHRELKTARYSRFTHNASLLRYLVRSENIVSPLIRTPAEWFGMSGLSYADTQAILPNAINVYPYWKKETQKRKKWDLFDFKASVLTPITASELHIRKVRNFADSIGSNIVLPFANQKIAEYFSKMPEHYLFDRLTLKNKLILRILLKDKIGLDSDKLGKLGFSYDSRSIVLNNWHEISREISDCELWNTLPVYKAICRMKEKSMLKKGWGAEASSRYIYRLYLVSAWYKYNRYLK